MQYYSREGAALINVRAWFGLRGMPARAAELACLRL